MCLLNPDRPTVQTKLHKQIFLGCDVMQMSAAKWQLSGLTTPEISLEPVAVVITLWSLLYSNSIQWMENRLSWKPFGCRRPCKHRHGFSHWSKNLPRALGFQVSRPFVLCSSFRPGFTSPGFYLSPLPVLGPFLCHTLSLPLYSTAVFSRCDLCHFFQYTDG